MKKLNAMLIASLFMIATPLFAEESVSEKAAAKTNDAERAMKKTGHHMAEAVCAEGDAKCAAKKAKHRMQEGKDYVGDKAKEAGDKVDANGTPNK